MLIDQSVENEAQGSDQRRRLAAISAAVARGLKTGGPERPPLRETERAGGLTEECEAIRLSGT